MDGITRPMIYCENLTQQLHLNSMTTHELLQHYTALRCDQTVKSFEVQTTIQLTLVQETELADADNCSVVIRASYIRIVGERVLLSVHGMLL